ncbi:hypothetical protein SLS62_000429 [Diatrype stigma]|uniref:Uncharacterized protein n=1 Tax=Diatrype stigma TaxID=117547 RepID=A0AAN9YUF8_9PEZI
MKFFELLVTLAVLVTGVSSDFWIYKLRSNDSTSVSPNKAQYQFFTHPPKDCKAVLNVKITPGLRRKDAKLKRRLDVFSLRKKRDSMEWTNDMGFFGVLNNTLFRVDKEKAADPEVIPWPTFEVGSCISDLSKEYACTGPSGAPMRGRSLLHCLSESTNADAEIKDKALAPPVVEEDLGVRTEDVVEHYATKTKAQARMTLTDGRPIKTKNVIVTVTRTVRVRQQRNVSGMPLKRAMKRVMT